jgi:RHH-type transcriptional regulator, rel operon repressor / antitoxin RelB
MLALRLSIEVEHRLKTLARKTGRTKSYYAKKAIVEFLEDQEDYYIAVERLRERMPTMSLEEVIKRLGLENEMGN